MCVYECLRAMAYVQKPRRHAVCQSSTSILFEADSPVPTFILLQVCWDGIHVLLHTSSMWVLEIQTLALRPVWRVFTLVLNYPFSLQAPGF